mmetsp:Transcript_2536/g.5631  ORF Transcript_2536/g.5631 Transcript_2536/m.5631 type:complete len:207 (-) Transcript_2536:1076-1696(-)
MDLPGGNIRSLMLGDNKLGEEGCSAIARALRNNDNLEFLYLDDNQIGVIGLEMLADALRTNSSLKRLHLKHNSFQLKPLIRCVFNEESVESVADSNHSLKHIFLNCGYEYESDELEMLMKLNRLGPRLARRKKVAMFLQRDLDRRLFGLGLDLKLLPYLLSILSDNGNLDSLLRVVKGVPSEVSSYRRYRCDEFDAREYSMDIEFL